MKKIYFLFAAAIALIHGCEEATEFEIEKPDAVTIAPESRTVNAKGGTVEVAVTSNGEWSLEGSAAWAKISSASGKDGDIIRFTVLPNETEKDRTAVYTFRQGEASAEFTLSQKNITVADEIRISSHGSRFTASGGKTQVTVVSSSDWTLSGSHVLVTPSATEGKSGDKVTFTVQPNNTGEKQTAEFIFSAGQASETFTIESEPGEIAALEITSEIPVAAFNTEHIEIILRTNIPYRELEVAIPENAGWITGYLAMETEEQDIVMMYINLAENKTGEPRSAAAAINGAGLSVPVEITQHNEHIISIEKSEVQVNASGEEIIVPIEHNVEYRIEIPEDAQNWIQHNGKLDGTERFTISPFEASVGSQRDAKVIFVETDPLPIAGKAVADTIHIIQRTGALVNCAIDFTNARTAPVWGNNFSHISNLSEFTIEFLMYVNEMKPGKVPSNIFGMDKNFVIRMGEKSWVQNNQMQIHYYNRGGNPDSYNKFTVKEFTFKEKQWYHIAVTLKDGGLALFVDGKLIAGKADANLPSVNFGAAYDPEGNCFHMGYVKPAYDDFKGLMAEFRIWNKALTEKELQEENHFYTVSPDSDGLVAYWKMNDAQGNTVKDYGKYGYHMIAHKDVTWEGYTEGANWVEVALPFE